MGFLDTFSKKFGFTADEEENVMDEEENEIDEDDDEDGEEDVPFSFRFPSNLFKRKTSGRGRGRFDDEEDDDEDTDDRRYSKRNNIIHDPRMSAHGDEVRYTHCERIIYVRQIEECREIIRFLLRGESILLNLESVDPKDCGRVVDLLSGAAFALQGRMVKIAHLSYLLAPENVEVVKENHRADQHARYRG